MYVQLTLITLLTAAFAFSLFLYRPKKIRYIKFEPWVVFLGVYVLIYPLRGLMVYFADRTHVKKVIGDEFYELFPIVFLISTLGILSILLGVYLASKFKIRKNYLIKFVIPSGLAPSFFMIIFLYILGLSALVMRIKLDLIQFGAGQLIADTIQDPRAFPLETITALKSIGFIWSIHSYFESKDLRKLLLLVVLTIIEIYFALVSASKADMLFIILAFLVIYWFRNSHRTNYLNFVWILLSFIFIAVPIVEGYRLFIYASHKAGFDRFDLDNLFTVAKLIGSIDLVTVVELASSRLHAFDSLILLNSKIHEVGGFRYGETIWLFFPAFIPRAFWPEKPFITQSQWFNTEVWNSHLNYEVNAGISIYLPNDLYLNFGFIGFLLSLIVFGFITARLTRILNAFSHRSPYVVSYYAYFMVKYCILWEGAFAAYFSGIIKVLIFYVFIFNLLSVCQRFTMLASPRDSKPNA